MENTIDPQGREMYKNKLLSSDLILKSKLPNSVVQRENYANGSY